MSLQERVTRILKQPKSEWSVIEAEQTDTATLYKSYIAPLAAIPAVCGFIGLVVVGVTMPFVGHYRWGVLSAFRMELFQYIGQLLSVFVCAVVVAKLAPKFGSQENQLQALKLVAYASTPVWVAGVLNLVPMLAFLIIFAALYSVYLFYLGVPVLMKTPQDKVIPYMLVSVLVIIVVYILISMVLGIAGGTAYTMGGGVI